MSCKSNNDKGKGCLDGDCIYPFIPNYIYCHDPDGKKNKTPVFTPVKHKKNGKMICATTVNPKKVMKTYGYVGVRADADAGVRDAGADVDVKKKKAEKVIDIVKTIKKKPSPVRLVEKKSKEMGTEKTSREPITIPSQIATQFNITASSNSVFKGRYLLDSSVALASKSKFPMPGNIDPYHATGLVYHNRDTGVTITMGSLYGDDSKYYRTWWIDNKGTCKEYVVGPTKTVIQTLHPSSLSSVSSLRLTVNAKMSRVNHDIFHALDENTRKALLKIEKHSMSKKGSRAKKSLKKRVYLGGFRVGV